MPYQLHKPTSLQFRKRSLSLLIHWHLDPHTARNATSHRHRPPNPNISPQSPTPRLLLSPPYQLQLPLLITHQILTAIAIPAALPTLLRIPILPGILADNLIFLGSEDGRSELLATQFPDEGRPRRGEERLCADRGVRGDIGQRDEGVVITAEEQVDRGLGFEDGGEL